MKKVTIYGWGLLVCVAALAVSVYAQDSSEPKQINGGVLNGKAVSLPKPPYPPAARAVGASGPVTVQVIIDVSGDVLSATAISGHPLLRAASVEAARAAKFSPTTLSGVPVKVAGVITYNFVGPLHLARIAFVLSHANQTSTFGSYSDNRSLAYQLPADWLQEKEILNSLTFEEAPRAVEKAEAEIKPAETPSSPPPANKNRYTVKGDGHFTIVGSASADRAQKLDTKSIASVRNLSEIIETRAAEKEHSAWVYEVGTVLGKLVAESGDTTKLRSHCSSLESLVNRAPGTITEYSLGQLREFVQSCQTVNDETKHSILYKAEQLSNMRY